MGYLLKKSLGTRSRKIAMDTGIPIVTVESVIKAYLKDLDKSLQDNERVVIDGLVTLTVVQNEDGELIPHARSSPALKSKLKSGYIRGLAQ